MGKELLVGGREMKRKGGREGRKGRGGREGGRKRERRQDGWRKRKNREAEEGRKWAVSRATAHQHTAPPPLYVSWPLVVLVSEPQ